MQKKKIAFIGNPNCGKTTLFNAFTGEKLKVANYPGVTIERRTGELVYNNTNIEITDLPGIYSLNTYSIEEIVSKEFIENEELDAIVNVVDASNLERNLYLTLQLVENGVNVIVALNMMDIVKKRGMNIDIGKIERRLGLKVIPVSAIKREGLEELAEAIIKTKGIGSKLNIKNDTEQDIAKKYNYIEYIVEECLENKNEEDKLTEKIDKVVTNKFLGLPIFILIMGLVFFLTFTIGDYIKEYLETALEIFSNKVLYLLDYLKMGPAMKSLIVEGIIAGVGGILTFLPNIFILFLCLAFLEDTGYMSRVAYVMSGMMNKIGLSGKACIPMILGFGCSAPAVMATRMLKEKEDRLKTIMLIPCISCSAKIPVYVLFSDMFFEKYATMAALSMYLIGIIIAIIIGYIVNKVEKKSKVEELIIELPDYKIPDLNSIRIYVTEKVKEYIEKAGTTIFIASLLLWAVLNIGVSGYVESVEESIGAMLGKWIAPLLKPAGLGYWQVAVALISGIAAKEVVISSMNVLYGIGKGRSLYGALQLQGFTMINAYSFMLFCLLYTPCIATIATIKQETKSIRFTIRLVIFQLVLAWTVCAMFNSVANGDGEFWQFF